MADADNKPNSQQQPADKPTYNEKQYNLLKKCSDNGDIAEWNKWREEHPDETVKLLYAQLKEFWLQRANLQGALLLKANIQGALLDRANLQDAELSGANLRRAGLEETNLQGARLRRANLQGAELMEANLQGANLIRANLGQTNLWGANLQGANLLGANLQHAELRQSRLENASLLQSNLRSALIIRTDLQHADFSRAIVDGGTLIWKCEVDRNTKFEGVGLDTMRIYPATKQLLQYNIRRMNWEEWYKGESKNKWVVIMRKAVTFPVRLFWAMSDYGRSTLRIIGTFFGFALLFAAVYYLKPELVENLRDSERSALIFVRACYFSVVTMTTLGFGDMYANKGTYAGHILLMLQVLLGYILLAALVTRFAVLFTVGGPAGKFPKRKPKKEAKSEEDKKQESGKDNANK